MLVLTILISSMSIYSFAQGSSQAKKRTITGVITSSEDNQPIIGATVWLKNSSTGTTTDLNGMYSVNVQGVGGALAFSYLGMTSQEIEIGNRNQINVVLKPDEQVIDEVVIVGYGNQKKASVVGAISTVNVANLKVAGSSISSVLSGQLSGVVSMNRSGEPGKASAAEFYIRGVSSFAGSKSPLVLVDGVERELDLVDVEDIESFSLLKDAAASAVYGVRGANGVILINTKAGAQGKPVITARVEAGVTAPTRMPSFLGSNEWAELANEMLGREYYTETERQKYRDGSDTDLYPNVNWMNTLYNDVAQNQRVNLNISGGGEVVDYYISGSFYNESSIFKNASDRYDYNSSVNYKKYNFRANVNVNVTKTTKLNVNLANIYEKSFGPGVSNNDIWFNAFKTSPNAFPAEYSNGMLSGPSTDSGHNPWSLLAHSGYREQFWNSSQSLIGIKQNLDFVTPGLSANIKFSWDAANTTTQIRSKSAQINYAIDRDEDGMLNTKVVRPGTTDLKYERSTDGTMTTYLEGAINYDRLFADKHRVGALFLYNQKVRNNTQTDDGILSLPYKNQGIASRVTYAYKDTYLLEANMGYNGSENFARGHRFGFFPAAAVGYVLSNENWFEPLIHVVSFLKFRGSYGIVGNDNIGGGRWIYQSTVVNTGGWSYGSTGQMGTGGGLRMGNIENLNVSWEEARKTDIGVEISLFDKVKLTADYFHEKRSGIFLERNGLPAIAGISTNPMVNIGESKNQGFDGSLEYNQKFGEFFVNARGTFSYNRNELLNNDQPDWAYKYMNRIGKPFGSGGSHQYGLTALGLFTSQEEIDNSPKQMFGEYRVGDIKYKDINGDGKVDTYDETAIGYTNLPEITYGMGATVQWRSWDLSVFFQGVSHVSFWTGGASMQPFSDSDNLAFASINSDIYGNVWMSTNTPEQNASAIYPRLSKNGGPGANNNNINSTWNMKDGSFLRLKNFEIGYTLPSSVIGKTCIKSLRVYASGNNMLTFSKFKLWDPELDSADGSKYPANKVFMLGLQAKF